jgi:hypothetical protein
VHSTSRLSVCMDGYTKGEHPRPFRTFVLEDGSIEMDRLVRIVRSENGVDTTYSASIRRLEMEVSANGLLDFPYHPEPKTIQLRFPINLDDNSQVASSVAALLELLASDDGYDGVNQSLIFPQESPKSRIPLEVASTLKDGIFRISVDPSRFPAISYINNDCRVGIATKQGQTSGTLHNPIPTTGFVTITGLEVKVRPEAAYTLRIRVDDRQTQWPSAQTNDTGLRLKIPLGHMNNTNLTYHTDTSFKVNTLPIGTVSIIKKTEHGEESIPASLQCLIMRVSTRPLGRTCNPQEQATLHLDLKQAWIDRASGRYSEPHREAQTALDLLEASIGDVASNVRTIGPDTLCTVYGPIDIPIFPRGQGDQEFDLDTVDKNGHCLTTKLPLKGTIDRPDEVNREATVDISILALTAQPSHYTGVGEGDQSTA